jgi:hypothetical protein
MNRQRQKPALIRVVRNVIPAARRADWYARGVGGAAAREIKKIPAARPLIEESMFRAAGISLVHRKTESDFAPVVQRFLGRAYSVKARASNLRLRWLELCAQTISLVSDLCA